ncbi:MAG TPA: amidohydrolase family protein [Burkholderiales bacterium]|nr:amidohydrolase family protein [Burkholderiales bacterium]
MPIIDSQIHPYEANTPKRPWQSTPNWPPSATADENIAAMDKLGIDGAILISAFSIYRYDAAYAVEAYKAHPDRFALVKPVDPDDPAVADVIAEWKKTPGTVGVRIQITKEPGRDRDPNHPGFERIARAAARHDFPLNILCWGNIDAGAAIIDRFPETRFIIDHLAILQPRTPPAPPNAWADLPKVLELAKRDQGEWRLHALSRTVSVPGYLGSACAHFRRVGVRSLPLGHGLDARQCGRQLRAGHPALPGDQPPERKRARDAHGRCLRKGV